MAYFIKNFLKDRTFRTKMESNYSETKRQEEGVPQGSVLSCCLFSLAINNIITCLPANIKCSLYVDDFMIYALSKYLPSLERRLHHAVNSVYLDHKSRFLYFTEQNGSSSF
jgi:retron-type reverse transcriptase